MKFKINARNFIDSEELELDTMSEDDIVSRLNDSGIPGDSIKNCVFNLIMASIDSENMRKLGKYTPVVYSDIVNEHGITYDTYINIQIGAYKSGEKFVLLMINGDEIELV